MEKEPKKNASKTSDTQDPLKRIESAVNMLVEHVSNVDRRLAKLENPKVEMPEKAVKSKSGEFEMELPYKAKEALEKYFPEAKVHNVKPHKGGYMIIVDLTDITGGKMVTATRPRPEGGSESYETHELDLRNIPVEAMNPEKSIKDRVKVIKTNLGWIKKEQTPQTVEKELKPNERPMPAGIKGTPEEKFFTTDVN